MWNLILMVICRLRVCEDEVLRNETSTKNKNISDLYRSINNLRKE